MSLSWQAGPVQVKLGFSCFLLGAFACIFLPGQAPALLLSMALHEGGHLLAMAQCGAAPRQLELSALGCRIVLPPVPLTPSQNAAISLSGPAANLVFFLLCVLACHAAAPFALSNLALGLLHLLPIEPLDGGLALHALLEAKLTPAAADRVSRAAAVGLLVPLAALGFLVLLRTRYNYTLLALAVYLMLYLVLGVDYGC